MCQKTTIARIIRCANHPVSRRSYQWASRSAFRLAVKVVHMFNALLAVSKTSKYEMNTGTWPPIHTYVSANIVPYRNTAWCITPHRQYNTVLWRHLSLRYKQCSVCGLVRVRTSLVDRIGSGPHLVGRIGQEYGLVPVWTPWRMYQLINCYPTVQRPASTHPGIACVDCVNYSFRGWSSLSLLWHRSDQSSF